MTHTTTLQRLLAWLLIAVLANPSWSTWARDTDIYKGSFTTASAAEPNILLVIDTSDSMNLPLAWKEVPGAYDSHVEYLWNDLNVISSFEVRTASTISISTGNTDSQISGMYIIPQATDPFYNNTFAISSMFGFNGINVGDNISLSGMPIAALNGSFRVTGSKRTMLTMAIPPGVDYLTPGYTNRYTQSGWDYTVWTNTGSMTISGGIGGAPPPDASTVWGYWDGTTTAARRQLWQNALAYAQGTEPNDDGPRYLFRNYGERNALYWLPAGTPENDKRLYSNGYNRFYGADALTTYGGRVDGNSHLKRGGIDFGVVPAKLYGTNNQCQDSLASLTPSTVFAPSTYSQNSGTYKGQSWQRYERYLNLDASRTASYPGSSSANAGYYQGYLDTNRDSNTAVPTLGGALPVVVSQAGSYAGWANLKPDWGGFHLADRIIDAWATWGALKSVLGVYGVDTSGLGTANDVVTAANKNLKIPGYYDALRTVTIGASTAIKSRSCSYSGPISDGPDAITQTFSYGGTCSDGGVSCKVGVMDCDPALAASMADPGACAQAVAGPYYTRNYANCHWINRQSLNTRTYSGCHWTNGLGGDRTTVTIGHEGAGDSYFVNGKCTGSCDGPDCEHATDEGSNYCVNSTIPTKRLNHRNYHNVLQSNGSNNINSGCTNRSDGGDVYYYGGSCVGNYRDPPGAPWSADTTDACNKSVTWADKWIGGTHYHDVRTDSIGAGCSNKVDTTQTCDDRHPGGLCPYLNCANRSVTRALGGTDYTVSDRINDQERTMVHDCVADEGATGPFMTKLARAFGTRGSPYDGRYSSAAGNTTADNTLMYDVAAAQRIDTAPAYDIYSTNYLNWKYGPKSNGNPIGRQTRLQSAKDVLIKLVQAQDGVRFGLMVFNQQDTSYSTEGGNVAFAVQRMGTKDSTAIASMSAAEKAANDAALDNRKALIAKINNLVATAQTPLTESLYEAYLYFRGEAPQFGNLTTTALTGGKVSAGCDRKAYTTPGAGPAGSDCLSDPPSSGNYRSPMLDLKDSLGNPAMCQKNFVVMVTDGGPEDDSSVNDAIRSLVYQKSPTQVISPSTAVNTPVQSTPYSQFSPDALTPFGPVDAASQDNDGGYIWLDELAYFMANAKVSPAIIPGVQTVSTYTIGFAGTSTPVLANAATVGLGKNYTADNPEKLAEDLTGVINAIRAWQPIAGGSTVVPISALNRAENSDNIYLGFFGPSANTRWDGTLKKYILSDVTTPGAPGYCGSTPSGDPVTLCLTGQTPLSNDFGETVWNVEWVSKNPDAVTGQAVSKINDSAVSFWSPAGGATDGGSARKGGSGQVLIGSVTPATRKLYTFLSGGASRLNLSDNALDETNGSITKALLGNAGMSDAARAKLVNFARGGDPNNAACGDADPASACNAWRDWAHADILHSKPAILDYGASGQYAFYVTTDGTLHAVNTADGKERWGFTIEEALPAQGALLANNAVEHLIVADGSPSIFFDDANHDGQVDAGDKAMLYFGQRRGGSAYYAIDVTDIDAPKFTWKIVGGMGLAGQGKRCVDTSCAAESTYDELGQTWSYPGVGKVRAKTPAGGRPTPVVIFAGGYDPNQDNDPVVDADSMGRALYIVDGYSGAIVKKFDNSNTAHGMSSSIPSDAAASNTDLDAQNLLDRVYVGDSAGNLYRFDIDDADPGLWTGGRIAQLAMAGTPTKILFAPALVKQQEVQSGATVAFDAVYIGTGDREHPLKSSGTADKVFMIKDKTSVDPDYSLDAKLGDLVDITSKNASQYAAANTSSTKGWYYSLPGAGEKVASMLTVLNNVLRFATYSPLELINSCVPAGRGQLYGMDAMSGAPLDPTKYKMLPSNPHIFAGFFSQGYIGHAVPIIFRGRMYVLQVTETGQILPGASTIGSVAKVYWYREAER